MTTFHFFLFKGERHVWMTSNEIITKFQEVFSRFEENKNVINISSVENWFKLIHVIPKTDFMDDISKILSLSFYGSSELFKPFTILSLSLILSHTFLLSLSLSTTSYLQMLFKIGILKNFAKFTGKYLCWSVFLIKFQV